MGLISADELKRWLNGFKETDNISPVYMRTLIDSQPTVDAIPIEWLIKVMDAVNDAQNYADYETLNWLLDEWKNNKESFM